MGQAHRFGVFAALLATATLAESSPVGAAGRVLRPHAGGNVTEVRLVRAASSEWSRQWTQYRMSGSGRIAIVTPVPTGTFVDPVADAWFEALEAATAPRVVPPTGTPECGGYGLVHVTGNLSHSATLGPSHVAVLNSVGQVQSLAQNQGLPFYDSDQQALEAYPPPYLALVYQLSGGSQLTQAVRYTTNGVSSPIPLAVAYDESATPDLTLWTIGEGRARIVNAVELTPDVIDFTWLAAQGKSDYPERRRERLIDEKGSAWMIETTGTAPLFQFGVIPNQGGAMPPVVSEYFERAISQGSATGTASSCLEGVWDAQELGKTGARVADPCPAGALTTVPVAGGGVPDCDPTPGAGEIDALTLVCGGADDLASAFAGMDVNRARITRQRGVLHEQSHDVTLELYEGPSMPRVLTAPAVNLDQCVSGTGGSSGGGYYGGSGSGSGAQSGTAGYAGGYVEETHTDVNVSCSGSSSDSGGDSCSGDSSSSSDDSCSGDSSSSSDDSCSGDSSSGSDDACSGDSSSGSGDSCSGDSSGGGGEGCSGDSGGGCSSGSSGGGDCSVANGARRVKPTLWLITLAAVAFPLRRRGRAKRRAGRPV
jgi:hypothetical protein